MKKIVLPLFVTVMAACSIISQKAETANPSEIVNETGSFIDSRDNKKYTTVTIGDQTWMSQNLDYQCEGSFYYKNSSRNANFYGRLYTFEAALDACPDGWHLPSDEEWKELEIFLGMPERIANESDWRGTDQGKQLSVKGKQGFNVMMGGYRNIGGNFGEMGEICTFWTSSSHSDNYAWGRGFELNRDKISRRTFGKTYGFSVRCLKD